jgi:multidrug efflux pump subunit AcrA (membrane-fusion protein)
MPAQVVERRGCSDRRITTLLAGVVTHVAVFIGDTVRPGDELFTLRLNSEALHNSQTELFKTARELQIVQDQRARLEKAAGALPESRLLEVEYQQRRLTAAWHALRLDLTSRGLSAEQVQGIAEGKFVSEITVRVPADHPPTRMSHATNGHSDEPPVYTVEEVQIHLGEQAKPGDVLCVLADHHALYIEGRAFKNELPLVERAAQQGWAVEAELVERPTDGWPPLSEPLRIQFLGNRVDADSQTVPFYLSLPNAHREYTQAGRTYRTWRFHPGQRVRLRLPVEEFTGVFVLPAAAVVREGPEAYVFLANGEVFDRKPVHVLHEDRRYAVIANDGSILEGNAIAHNGAAALNRVLKAQAAGGEQGHHHHHDH